MPCVIFKSDVVIVLYRKIQKLSMRKIIIAASFIFPSPLTFRANAGRHHLLFVRSLILRSEITQQKLIDRK